MAKTKAEEIRIAVSRYCRHFDSCHWDVGAGLSSELQIGFANRRRRSAHEVAVKGRKYRNLPQYTFTNANG